MQHVANSKNYECYAISFDYGQRNHAELVQSALIAKTMQVKEHRVIRLEINNWGGSALTDHTLAVPQHASQDIPITYVPARNTIFLAAALGWAEVLGAHDLFIGANIIDYANYPDCRPEYLKTFEKLANLATRAGIEGNGFKIHAPLLEMSKAEIIKLGKALGVDYSITISCYTPDREGASCGSCDSCRFRSKGFSEAGLPDPTLYQKKHLTSMRE